MESSEILALLLVVVFNGVFDAVVVAYLAGRRSKQALINALIEPDEGTKQAIRGVFREMWVTMNEPSIKIESGKDEEGKPKFETLTPLQSIIGEIGRSVLNRIRGLQGSTQAGANRMAADVAGLAGIPMPKRGQSTSEFLLEQLGTQLIPRLGPIIEKKLEDLLSKQGRY